MKIFDVSNKNNRTQTIIAKNIKRAKIIAMNIKMTKDENNLKIIDATNIYLQGKSSNSMKKLLLENKEGPIHFHITLINFSNNFLPEKNKYKNGWTFNEFYKTGE